MPNAVSRCFNSEILQMLHKYADMVLLLLIGMLTFWGKNIESDVRRLTLQQAKDSYRIEQIANLQSDIMTLKLQLTDLKHFEAMLRRHEEIIGRVETKLDSFLNTRHIGP